MQHCTSCKKAYATIHILDLRDGAIVEQKHLCASCAENAGMVQQKVPPLKVPFAEMHELISSFKLTDPESARRTDNLQCPGCGLTGHEFKVRGRMGCPRCYETFKTSLVPLLERVHDATSHRGRYPGMTTEEAECSTRRHQLAALRLRLESAIDAENYEEAARLRDAIRAAETEQGEVS